MFIEVHSINGFSAFVNLQWLVDIREKNDGGCTVFTTLSPFHFIECKESYDEIKKLIQEALQ